MQKIKINGLSCEHCVNAVTEALQDVPGVTKVEVSLKKLWQKESVAKCEGTADIKALHAAIIEAGYEPVG